MKSIYNQQTLAIFSAENLIKDTKGTGDERYHSFLMLVDQTSKEINELKNSDVLQQIHYGGNLLNRATASLTKRHLRTSIHDMHLECHFKGAAFDVLRRWYQGAKFAYHVAKHGVEECSQAPVNIVNCRTGTENTLSVMSLTGRSNFINEFCRLSASVKLNSSFPDFKTQPLNRLSFQKIQSNLQSMER